MSGRARCRVRLLVTNDGTQAAAPQAYQGKFTVNGQPSMTADLAFSNGTMDQKWQSLKPNDTAVMERELCADIFPAPGKYTVGFQIGNDLVTAVANVSP